MLTQLKSQLQAVSLQAKAIEQGIFRGIPQDTSTVGAKQRHDFQRSARDGVPHSQELFGPGVGNHGFVYLIGCLGALVVIQSLCLGALWGEVVPRLKRIEVQLGVQK